MQQHEIIGEVCLMSTSIGAIIELLELKGIANKGEIEALSSTRLEIMLPYLSKIIADQTLLNNVQNYIEEHKGRF
jgi:hypothetical protein